VYTIVKELKKFGYLRLERFRNTDGTYNWISTIYEIPLPVEQQETPVELENTQNPNVSPYTETPDMVEPDMVEPDMVEPDTENPVITKNFSNAKLNDVKLSNLHTRAPANAEFRDATSTGQTGVCALGATPKKANIKTEAYTKVKLETQPAENSQKVKSTLNVGKARATNLRGSSRFTFDECLAYAEHLHTTGQGVTTPVGLAKKVYKTGSDDRFIVNFLEAQKQKEVELLPFNIDTTQCPDCHGRNLYYPKGHEHGVARCKHSKLHGENEANTVAA
jgi:hypothetical protein